MDGRTRQWNDRNARRDAQLPELAGMLDSTRLRSLNLRAFREKAAPERSCAPRCPFEFSVAKEDAAEYGSEEMAYASEGLLSGQTIAPSTRGNVTHHRRHWGNAEVSAQSSRQRGAVAGPSAARNPMREI
jgi:hypothetical protein